MIVWCCNTALVFDNVYYILCNLKLNLQTNLQFLYKQPKKIVTFGELFLPNSTRWRDLSVGLARGGKSDSKSCLPYPVQSLNFKRSLLLSIENSNIAASSDTNRCAILCSEWFQKTIFQISVAVQRFVKIRSRKAKKNWKLTVQNWGGISWGSQQEELGRPNV